MAGLVGGRNVINTVNNLINARSVFLILGSKRGRLMDRKRLKETAGAFILITEASSAKLICFRRHSREFKISGISTPLIVHLGLGRLEILIALSNPNIDVRILGQGYCVTIVSLSLL